MFDPNVAMLKILTTGMLALALVVAPAAGALDIKIGFVNAAKILDEAPQAEQARNRLEQEFAPRDRALVDTQRELRNLEEQLAEGGLNLEDAARRDLERDIIAQKRDLKRAQEEFREDFNLRRNEELGKLQRQVYEAIVSLAEEERFDLIVNDGAVIFASPQVDITDEVLKRLSDAAKTME